MGFFFPLDDTKENYINEFVIRCTFISPSCANSGCTPWYFKPLSSTRVTIGFLVAVIQWCVPQIAFEMEETGQFHLVDFVRHVLSGWLPKCL